MNLPRVSCLFFLLGLAVAPTSGAPWPFTVDNPHGQWQVAPVRKEPVPGVTIEIMITHVDGLIRFFVISSPKPEDPAESLLTFASRIEGCFPGYKSANRVENETEEFGFAGRELRFDLLKEKGDLACELFVFAYDQTWWGVMRVMPKAAPSPSQPTFGLFHKKLTLPPGVVGLAPVRVRDNPLTSFPIGLDIVANRETNRIEKITVNEVPPGSITEREGVRIGDEILAIDGRKVTDFATGVGKDSELGRVMLNREAGDRMELEVKSPKSTKSRTVMLRVSSQSGFFWPK